MDLSTKILCKFKGHRSGILLHLIDPTTQIDRNAYESQLLEYCLDRVGRRENVYWLQIKMPRITRCTSRPFIPIVYKKLNLFSMPAAEVMENVQYMVDLMANHQRNQMSAMIVNFSDYHEIDAFDTSCLLEFMRKLSIHIDLSYPYVKEHQRIMLCLPATDGVINAISRLLHCELVYL